MYKNHSNRVILLNYSLLHSIILEFSVFYLSIWPKSDTFDGLDGFVCLEAHTWISLVLLNEIELFEPNRESFELKTIARNWIVNVPDLWKANLELITVCQFLIEMTEKPTDGHV